MTQRAKNHLRSGFLAFCLLAIVVLAINRPLGKLAAREPTDKSLSMEMASTAIFKSYVRSASHGAALPDPGGKVGEWNATASRYGLRLVRVEVIAKHAQSLDDIPLGTPVLKLSFVGGRQSTVGFGFFLDLSEIQK